jgi:2-polyprenyl-3-methyl-5-hydroxy-6-metoxy-1,4-benzoquinol methylase
MKLRADGRQSIPREQLKILDFGCGNGAIQAARREDGEDDLIGFDTDPEGVLRGLALRCYQYMEDLRRNAPFDVIALHRN